MIGWLIAWAKAWVHTLKMQKTEKFQVYVKEYVKDAMKRQEEEVKDARICMAALTLMRINLVAGAAIWLLGMACLILEFVLFGVLLTACAGWSIDFLMESGRIRREAKRYAFEKMREGE